MLGCGVTSLEDTNRYGNLVVLAHIIVNGLHGIAHQQAEVNWSDSG